MSFLLDTNLSRNKGNLPIVTVAMGKYCGINVEMCEGVPCTDVSYFPDSLGETIKLKERQDTRFFGVWIEGEEGINRFITESERIEEIANLKAVLFRFAKRLLLF